MSEEPEANNNNVLVLNVTDLMSPPSGADLHGERWGCAAAVEAHRQPGDSNQRAGGLEPATGQAEEPDGESALDWVRPDFTIH